MIALNVVLTELAKLLPFAQIVRVSLSFIPIAAAAVLYGSVPAGVSAALADIISFFIFPDGAYFPGFTASAFLAGIFFGILLYKKKPSLIRTFTAAFFVILFVDVSLNTVWLYMIIPGKTFLALFVPRLIKSLLMIPIEAFTIFAIWPVLERLRMKNAT